MRDITKVINAMLAALKSAETPAFEFGLIEDRLQFIRMKCGFTPPELMQTRWHELVDAFNSWTFKSGDPGDWDIRRAPKYARAAGEILAGRHAQGAYDLEKK